MDAREKLIHLSEDAQYDLSCACGSKDQDRRIRGPNGLWVYPASVARGGRAIVMKTLVTNSCKNDCAYCPLRTGQDSPRYSLQPDELANLFIEYQRSHKLIGLFLTSGVVRTADATMQKIVDTAAILRKRHGYRGFMHLKIIPGASDAAIESALSLASTVSLNVESPHRRAFSQLSASKDFDRDIVQPIRRISELTGKGGRFQGVRQTTQFIVGAADEADRDIVGATFGLYRRLKLDRVYFSAYQRPADQAQCLPDGSTSRVGHNLLTREHRLYQADFLIRKYKWSLDDIGFEDDGNLSLATDPKTHWAKTHPEFFPVRLATASKQQLLRVPGLGPITVGRILKYRKHRTLRTLADVGVKGKRLATAGAYVVMN